MSFADIPSDIFCIIACYSAVQEISRLCQVSRRFHELTLTDKHLWILCLRRDVIQRGIELPGYCQSLEHASAEDVRSWVKTSITLHNAYSSGGRNALVNSFVVDNGLEATWTKIIRGRSLLVALSNPWTSFIGLWRIQSNGSSELVNKFYLPGPVLDGVVEYVMEEVHLAITVGTTNPYVQILLLSAKDNTVCLESLQILEGARHVLLLKDFVVGYKTLYGDDTYPLLTEWRTGATLRLFPMIFNHQTHDLMGNIHSPCHAMGVWRNHLFVVFDFSVAIFPQPSFASLSPFHFDVQSLCFPFPEMMDDSYRVGEAYVYEAGEPLCRNLSKATYQSLRISVRDRYGSLCIRAIEQREDGLFSWNVNFLKESEFDVMSYRHCVGSSSEYQLRLASKSVYGKHPTFLDLIRLPRFESSNSVLGSQFGERQTFVVSARNVPILDLTTAMDFDDAAGVILLGSCRGEISIILFHDRSSQAPGSLLDNLPSVSFDLPYLQTAPMPMDLPHCYYVPDKIREGTVPGLVLEESIDRWDNDVAFSKIVPPPGWSSDWKNNRSIQNWVFSFPRWRTLSVDQAFHYDETWTRMLQFRLGNGDIIPIMYHEDNHDFVIFRIANRIYHFLRGTPLDEDLHRIMALPFSAQDLSNPNSLTHLWNERWRNGPLCNHSEDSPALSFLRRTEECLTVLDYLKTDSGRQQLTELSLSDDMRTWSLDDRRKMYMEANRWHWDAHKSMNSPQDEF